MPKTIPPRRRRAAALHAPPPRPDASGRAGETPVRRNSRDSRSLLDRLLDTPHLASVVPQLPPEVLHRLVRNCGLEDCGELVALATPAQLSAVFDLDLWRTDEPGLDETLDAARFGVWLEVLAESDAAAAARKPRGD